MKNYFFINLLAILVISSFLSIYFIKYLFYDGTKRSIFGQIHLHQKKRSREEEECHMATCFNFTKCMDPDKLLIYVYPDQNDVPQSPLYRDILKIIRDGLYYTSNPEGACLFIPSIDTTDRDRIRLAKIIINWNVFSTNYVKNIATHYSAIPKNIWNDGLNHLIFNFYFGTFPNYSDTNLGFNTGKSMLAWTSSSRQNFRRNFDVSIPLFHKEHPLSNDGPEELILNFPQHDKLLASFKGKRYVYGIGSETRDILHHLHNDLYTIISTTCKHNSDWKRFEDDRCQLDNADYERWNYKELMANSTFCFVPRGRRLASFRFLESLRSTCIPVIFSNDWINDYLASYSTEQIFRKRFFAQQYYQQYFSSVEKIVNTTIQIIFERIHRHLGVKKMKNDDLNL